MLLYFFKLLPFANLAIENVLSRYLKNIMASNLKIVQPIQDGEIIFINKLMVGGTVFHKHNF